MCEVQAMLRTVVILIERNLMVAIPSGIKDKYECAKKGNNIVLE